MVFSTNDLAKNCIICNSSYGNYKIGHESELYASWCCLPLRIHEDKKSLLFGDIIKSSGLCMFCNKNSFWYLDKELNRE